MTRTTYERWALKLEARADPTKKTYTRHMSGLLESCGHKPADEIDDSDVQKYINDLPNRPGQEVAVAAIRSFLKEVGRTVGDVALKPKNDPRDIYPLTDEEFIRLYVAVIGTRNRAILMILKDTGARITAVCRLRIEDFRGDHIILRGEKAKNKNTFTEKTLCHPARRKLPMTIESLNKRDRQPSGIFHYTCGGGGLA